GTGRSPARTGRQRPGRSTVGSSAGWVRRCSSTTPRRWRRGTRTRTTPELLGLEERVQAALGLGLARPAAVTLVLTGKHRPGAGRTADAGVALLEQRVERDAVPLEVVEGVA